VISDPAEHYSAGSQKNGDIVKRYFLKLVFAVTLAAGLGVGVQGQTIHPTPFFTSFADTLIASTYNGQPLVVGSIIQAYDPSGIYCGIDTARLDGGSGKAIFGYFSVYGDDPNTTLLDEGAIAGEHIAFKINGRTASVTDGDDTWTNQSLKSVTLAANATIAVSGIGFPPDTLIMPGDTDVYRVEVRNDGDGIDFYGVKLSMSLTGGSTPFDWQTFEPDTVVYAAAGGSAFVYFSVYAPIFNADTVNTISYTVFSELDTTKTVTGSFDLFMSVTEVDPDISVLPGSFALFQNYPNPFNPTTTIAYQLATSSTVHLEIIDVLGRIVDDRDLGRSPAGPGEIEFDGSELASGVYFYRLSTESGSLTKKMILLK
jgi:hypothetical protein